jgi:hypothetical protein
MPKFETPPGTDSMNHSSMPLGMRTLRRRKPTPMLVFGTSGTAVSVGAVSPEVSSSSSAA